MAGLVHFRHPCELGGIYYLLNCVMSQLSVFVSAFIYWYYVPSSAAGDILGAILNDTVGDSALANATATNSAASNLSLADSAT